MNGGDLVATKSFKKMREMKAKPIQIDLGRPNSEPQKQFFASRALYTLYGGAKGGGKSHSIRIKAIGGSLRYPGIKILIIRRTYSDMDNTLIAPMLKLIPQEVGYYNGSMHMLYFYNGSTIKFGHLPNYGATVSGEFSGQEYDWIFIDEAGQFTESEFRGLGGCLRGVNDIPKRMYLTANPGGVGHQWLKRLFVDRNFKPAGSDGEPAENPDDYVFIAAKATDNKDLMESSPGYMNMLNNLPPDMRKALRDGDWNAMAGQYFEEFKPGTHTISAFTINPAWKRFRTIDYGLDCFACLWIAVDFNGRCYVYREVAQSRLIVSDAAQLALGLTPQNEHIEYTIAPPDMWSTLKDTGKTMAQIFMENGIPLVKANNNRIQGWMSLKELLKPMPDGKPGMLVFNDCRGLIDDLQALQYDDKNVSDVAKNPHEFTHRPDALRYFAQSRFLIPEMDSPYSVDEETDNRVDYDEEMCGGEMSRSYLNY